MGKKTNKFSLGCRFMEISYTAQGLLSFNTLGFGKVNIKPYLCSVNGRLTQSSNELDHKYLALIFAHIIDISTIINFFNLGPTA